MNNLELAIHQAWAEEFSPYIENNGAPMWEYYLAEKRFLKWMETEWAITGFPNIVRVEFAKLKIGDPQLLTFFLIKFGY